MTLSKKRARPSAADDNDDNDNKDELPDDDLRPPTPITPPSPRLPKRRRIHAQPPPPGRDLLTPLSDELLLRILSFLPLHHLLGIAPVSRRFYTLSADSQLWKALYYARFVLPRAMRIPGFRDAGGSSSAAIAAAAAAPSGGHRLHYSGRRTLWADGRRGGVVASTRREGEGEDVPRRAEGVNWKRQYKIRHNWSRGKCAVEELRIGGGVGGEAGGRMLVKVVEGVAVTADGEGGLRAWDLKTRGLIAQTGVRGCDSDAVPSCIAVDDSGFERGLLEVALGFDDGSFGVWRLSTAEKRLAERYRHEKSSNGELNAMAFSYPYLLTATRAVLVSLYTFEVPETTASTAASGKLASPYLLTSLDSHTSRPPLALSIRTAGRATVASVAYSFSTRRGWSIGVQDLHVRQPAPGSKSMPEIVTTRIAYTTPIELGGPPPIPPVTPQRGRRRGIAVAQPPEPSNAPREPEPGPTTLCYTHPYLLATLPDNTLVLYMCTSNASSLSISDGIRLWGHTSGISDAEITARGKAVSVSARGEEMRVWELEGRSAGAGGRSVEIRPWQSPGRDASSGSRSSSSLIGDWDERRNWVGFDDEMVIVLKESKGARESLMVYDFT